MSDTNPPKPVSDAQNRVIARLAQEARIVQEARMLPVTGPLSQEQIDHARATLKKYAETKLLTIAEIGKAIGRSAPSVSQFLSGTYSGDNHKLARLAMLFVEQHAHGQLPGMPRGMVTTAITERILAVAKKVQTTGTIGVVFGPSGVSKSIVCRAVEAGIIAGSVYIECMQGSRSAAQFASLWADRLGLKSRGSLGELQRRIIHTLRDSRRLQMIDEAHYLSKPALNVVRDIHKQAGVGILLVGTVDVNQAVDDGTYFYGQMARLISYRYDIVEEQEIGGTPLFTVDEVVRLAASMQLKLTSDGAESLTELCCQPGWGGLGAAATLLLKAKLLAKGGEITTRHLVDAETSSHGRKYVEVLKLRRNEYERRIRIA